MNDEHNNNSKPQDDSFRFDQADLEDEEVHQIHDQLKREKEEPTEGFAVPPMLIVFISMFLCLWAGYEISHSSGDFRWDVYDPRFDASAHTAGPKEFDPIARGKKVFNNCIACHQSSGTGIPGVFPPLAGSDWIGKSPDILTRIVLNGLSGEIEVNGTIYSNAMTAFNSLSDKDVASVISYIRNSWGNAFDIVSIEEVAAIRASVGSRSSPFTASELLEMFPE